MTCYNFQHWFPYSITYVDAKFRFKEALGEFSKFEAQKRAFHDCVMVLFSTD